MAAFSVKGGKDMRRLMWFTIGFAAAIALTAYILPVTWLVFLAVLLLLLLPVLLLCKKNVCKVAAVVLIGAATGFFYFAGYQTIFLAKIDSCDGTTGQINMEATDYSFETSYGFAVDGTAEIEGRSYSVRLYYNDEILFKPGDRIQTAVKLRYTPGDGLQSSTYHKGEGIFLLAYAQNEVSYTLSETVPSQYFAAILRKNISNRISAIFPEDTAAFSKALLLGDDSEIGYGENLTFQKSGIRHIIAVSGLHVSILFSMVYFVTARKNLLTLLIGLPVLFLFAAVAGFTPSVVRACIMQALIILSMTVSKEYDQGTSLAFASLVILVLNPWTITSVSFQLSVGSMVGIFLFSRGITHYLLGKRPFKNYTKKTRNGRFVHSIAGSIGVTIGAMIVTLPLCAWYFGMVSVVSVVSNLLTLWIVSFVFCGIMVSCLASMLWMPLGFIIARMISWPIRYIMLIARFLSAVPGVVAYTDSPYTVMWIVSCVVLIALFFIYKRKSPALLAMAIAFFYILSQFGTWFEPQLDNVRLTVLDVGQGQCILMQSKNSAYLLDCGGKNPKQVADAAMQAMGAQGIYSLDGIILTHFDKDHANGTMYLLQAVPVDRLYLPNEEPDNKIRMELEAQNVPITWVTDRKELPCGSGELTVYPSQMSEKKNEYSMCILYQDENCAILVTGDRDLQGESDLLEQAELPKLDVLVVGHHGAYNSAGWELLTQTKPRVAIISVGEDNLHGHPNPYTLDRLYRFGCIVRRTDEEGTIHIRG